MNAYCRQFSALGNIIIQYELSQRSTSQLQDPIPVNSLQAPVLDASGQTTDLTGKQPHPSAVSLAEDFLSPQPPLDTPHDMALPTRGAGPAPPRKGQTQKKTTIWQPVESSPQTQIRTHPGTSWPWPFGEQRVVPCWDPLNIAYRGPLLQGRETELTFYRHKNTNRYLQ